MLTNLVSAVVVLIGGYAAGWLVERIKLPGMLGMMVLNSKLQEMGA